MGCSHSVHNETKKSEKAMKAAVLIQNWYRCYKARLELRRRQALNIFENIEYADEQDQMQLAKFFAFMLEHYVKNKSSADNLPKIFNPEPKRKSDEETIISLIEVPDTYYGPRLKFPLTFADVVLLIDAFKENQILHARYVLEVLLEAKKILQQMPNIIHISSTVSKELTICGDIHGKLDDLFLIFYKNGLPSGNNRYVFNGDFVDRGQNSMEVLMVLFSFLLVYPNDVYLNRGNHEDYLMNMRYGFTKEIMQKYKQHGAKILHLLEEVYTWLPIGTLIDKKVLVIHGGIADNTDLTVLEQMKRNRIITVFSASNYYEEGSNRGAYLKLSHDTTPRFFQYQSSQITQAKTLHERVDIVENAAFRILGERMIIRKTNLIQAFRKYDPNDTGKISLSDWAKATEEVLELHLPWMSLCPRLVKTIEDGYVLYNMGFKDLPVVRAPKVAKAGMVETLVRYRSDLKIIFNIIDKDQSGLISMDEFRAMWKLFCSHYNIDIEESHVDQLAHSMDLNKDGSIDFNEFLTAFDVVHRATNKL
ncbi:serine/threonine-protein phosphatase with EF-hands 1 isoform X3 [Sarcophilus harrisii]|uniref:serine/threonine-protein phosphatase with EF-hands 1 isoform X3 n=1 Tax=Sarcophilus harrisii TaxID=9305 RepID=UPI001301F493|nr:serine/threonine-protein phosphatase with EF-hands 1 isoform X3 [Sarcophilus harrisii]